MTGFSDDLRAIGNINQVVGHEQWGIRVRTMGDFGSRAQGN